MKKKVISSFIVALITVGASSISAFATTANGSVVIGSKSFDLAYANDTKNLTEITNAIVEGGAIYVKDFSGNWIDNNTGNTVDASVVSGGQVSPAVVKSVVAINITKNIGEEYTLPTTVTASLVNGTTKTLSVTWDKVADTKVTGNFTFIGILTMVDGVINSSNVTIIANLTVSPSVDSAEVEYAIKPQLDSVNNFSESLAAVSVDGKSGFVDKLGKFIIKPQFDGVGNFSEGLAMVKVDGKCGFVDKTGEIVIKPQFDYVGNFSEGLAQVNIDDKCGFINKNGEIVIEPQFDLAYGFKEDLAPVNVNGKWGFINETGEIVIEPQFDDIRDFSEGLAMVRVDDKWEIINKTGEIVIEPQSFDYVNNFSEGLVMIEIGDKRGFINKTGETVIEPQSFDYVNDFSEGLAVIEIGGKWGFINKTGEIV
ncbi:WG repeat-containing protein, partial [Clostridium sp. DSM 17811]|uniref:WG repeat-containing protein n=1 Tax=Clostridium sp. DSM 17811 TaxID=2843317 RepID=UPI001C0E00BC